MPTTPLTIFIQDIHKVKHEAVLNIMVAEMARKVKDVKEIDEAKETKETKETKGTKETDEKVFD